MEGEAEVKLSTLARARIVVKYFISGGSESSEMNQVGALLLYTEELGPNIRFSENKPNDRPSGVYAG